MSLSTVVDVALAELGNTEYPPGSNRVKYWELFGPSWQGQPWCVAFIAWCFDRAGEWLAFFGGGMTASCGTLLRWYREQGATVPASEARAGDIVILNFSGTQDTEHCGLVLGINSTDDSYLNVIEGNTSPGEEKTEQANGGCVALKHRRRSQVVGCCRPQYKADDPQDVSGHWAEAQIRRCMERGLLRGYPDGSFGPDKPVTRAELAVILDRLDKEDDGK